MSKVDLHTLSEKLYFLSCGGKIKNQKTGVSFWADNKSGKLKNDGGLSTESIPSIIFNNDIKFVFEGHL